MYQKIAKLLSPFPALQKLFLEKEEIIVYIIVGGLTTVVSWACKFLWNFVFFKNTLHPNNTEQAVLSIVAWVSGVLFAFPTNRIFVFKSKGNIAKEACSFTFSRIATLIMDILMMQLLGNVLGINVFVATIITSVLVVIANYVLSKVMVFNKGGNDKKSPQPQSSSDI
ncbi:MAG: GtrA family protein [Lachnospiraceae bacterium]|nr:GtrA family protein [Lachnospiraceae bacterium]